jgi:hypothetical protein
VVLVGAGIFFMVTLETRIKRRRALAALRELRAVAHIIDMHQEFDDDVALVAVNEVENLTTGLSRKIWQKLMIVHAMGPEVP